tara:strand:+ start:2168 stop:2749 length:582 start_codon:yes stop_codon:yes gene_type:complete
MVKKPYDYKLDKQGVRVRDKKLKCYMLRAKNGGMYRACATPEKKKISKGEVRGAPKPANERKQPYLVSKAKAPAKAKAKAKPKAKAPKMTVKTADRAKELMNKAKMNIEMMKRLKEHAKKHEGGMKGKHMKNMIKYIKQGDSFEEAHKKAKKDDIKKMVKLSPPKEGQKPKKTRAKRKPKEAPQKNKITSYMN